MYPVVGRSGVVRWGGADVGAGLDPGDVARIGPEQEAVRPLLQGDGGAVFDHEGHHAVILFLGAVAPMDPLWPAHGGGFRNPARKPFVLPGYRHGIISGFFRSQQEANPLDAVSRGLGERAAGPSLEEGRMSPPPPDPRGAAHPQQRSPGPGSTDN